METKWIPLTEQLPEGREDVVLFKPTNDDVAIPLVVSNPVYAKSALAHGYTHWCRIPYPLPYEKAEEVRHPGEHLMDELEAHGVNISKFIKEFYGMYGLDIRRFITDDDDITPEIAQGLAHRFDTSAEYWLNLQRAWDERSQS